ncbi:hypothetical protein C2G38_2105411 [Gigaspora rosea]|uniref:Uncharacterized protein n=1 Tax=Gigaspora rosea TaxID=44941 RepID=A0A397UNG7_9GLOM|nr:hypothetical protein C2G38_2105411 [Gigaspora rosea]
MFNITGDSTQPDDELSIIALSSFSQYSAFSNTAENDYMVLQHSIDNGVSKDIEMLSEQTIDNAIDDQGQIRDKVVIDL